MKSRVIPEFPSEETVKSLIDIVADEVSADKAVEEEEEVEE